MDRSHIYYVRTERLSQYFDHRRTRRFMMSILLHKIGEGVKNILFYGQTDDTVAPLPRLREAPRKHSGCSNGILPNSVSNQYQLFANGNNVHNTDKYISKRFKSVPALIRSFIKLFFITTICNLLDLGIEMNLPECRYVKDSGRHPWLSPSVAFLEERLLRNPIRTVNTKVP